MNRQHISLLFFLIVLFGYPPKEVSSYNQNNCLANIGMKKGDTIFLQELQAPRYTVISEEDTLATGSGRLTTNHNNHLSDTNTNTPEIFSGHNGSLTRR